MDVVLYSKVAKLENRTAGVESGKADKAASATGGNFAALDANGNLTDSGHKHEDYLTGGDVAGAVTDCLAALPGVMSAAFDPGKNVRDGGAKLAFTTEGGRITQAMDPLALPRVRVTGGNGLKAFAASIG